MSGQSVSLRAFRAQNLDEVFCAGLFDCDVVAMDMTVDNGTSLADIVSAARSHFGIVAGCGDAVHVAFGREMEDVDGELMARVHGDYLTVTDDEGALRWWVPVGEWATISYANLADSHAAGLIGDPTEILVVWSHQYGNGFLPIDWAAFVAAIEHAADVASLLQAVPAMARGLAVLKKRAAQWRDRRARPEDVTRFITHENSWDLGDLAKRLGIPKEDAKAVLALFGYSYDAGSRLYLQDASGRTAKVRNKALRLFEEYEGE